MKLALSTVLHESAVQNPTRAYGTESQIGFVRTWGYRRYRYEGPQSVLIIKVKYHTFLIVTVETNVWNQKLGKTSR